MYAVVPLGSARNTNTVNAAQIETFRIALRQAKLEIEQLAQSSRESAEPVELDQARVGRLSRMDALQMQQMAQETERRRQRQLTRIVGALGRIETGTYGACFACGDDIGTRRLSVDPATTRCMRCASNMPPA
ncbi:MAG: TraR/DksA C4-type zinc finger protein [Rhodanobacteraceae bacterium]